MKGQICDKLKKEQRLKKLSHCHAEKHLTHRVLHEMGVVAGTNFFTRTKDGLITISFKSYEQ
jgi:hypothetical protein